MTVPLVAPHKLPDLYYYNTSIIIYTYYEYINNLLTYY